MKNKLLLVIAVISIHIQYMISVCILLIGPFIYYKVLNVLFCVILNRLLFCHHPLKIYCPLRERIFLENFSYFFSLYHGRPNIWKDSAVHTNARFTKEVPRAPMFFLEILDDYKHHLFHHQETVEDKTCSHNLH